MAPRVTSAASAISFSVVLATLRAANCAIAVSIQVLPRLSASPFVFFAIIKITDHKSDKYADKILSTKQLYRILVRRDSYFYFAQYRQINNKHQINKTYIHIKYIFLFMLFNIMILLIGTL